MKENESYKSSDIEIFYNTLVFRQHQSGVNLRHQKIISLIKKTGLQKNHHVLEIGCGIGTVSGLILKHLKQGRLLALDLSPDSIDVAKQRLVRYQNAEFIAADVMNIEIKGQYDIIVLPDVLEHIPVEHHSTLFAKIHKLLNNNGFVFINIPNPEYLAWSHIHRKKDLQIIDQPLYSNELMQNIYSNNLIVTNLKTYSVWVRDGDYQFLVLKKKGVEDFSVYNKEKVSIWRKIKYKLNAKKQ